MEKLMEKDETEFSTEEVKHDVTLLSPLKSGTKIRNGIYQKRRVVIVEEDSSTVVEKSLKEDHILEHKGDFRDGKCSIYEYYVCTLWEFIALKRHGYDIRNIRCSADERDVLLSTNLLDNNNRHTLDAVSLLRDIVLALAELHHHKLIHGDLNVHNIVICVIQGKLRAKVTRLNRERRVGDDYGSLGEIIKQMFSYSDDKDFSETSPEAHDLYNHVEKYVVRGSVIKASEWRKKQELSEKQFLKNPRSLLTHPLFWTEEMCLNFIIQFRLIMKKCNSTHRYRNQPNISRFVKDMEDISRSDWHAELVNDPAVKWELLGSPFAIAYPYDKAKTAELLRFMRDMYCHFEEKSYNFKMAVGDIPRGFFHYFRRKFPGMLLETRRVLSFHIGNLQRFAGITCQFEEFL